MSVIQFLAPEGVSNCRSQMPKHSTGGVLSQGRNSKELTARETNGGTLGFKRKQRLKPYQYLYVDTFFFFSLCVRFTRSDSTFVIALALLLWRYCCALWFAFGKANRSASLRESVHEVPRRQKQYQRKNTMLKISFSFFYFFLFIRQKTKPK